MCRNATTTSKYLAARVFYVHCRCNCQRPFFRVGSNLLAVIIGLLQIALLHHDKAGVLPNLRKTDLIPFLDLYI